MNMSTIKPTKLLERLNTEYIKLHKTFEDYFWVSYMGDTSVDKKKNAAQAKRDAFRADPKNVQQIKDVLGQGTDEEKERLNLWLRFFNSYQAPKKALAVKNKIAQLESVILKKRSNMKTGYIDPYTKKFVECSGVKMRTMMTTHADEKVRKACFVGRSKMAVSSLDEYIKVVGLRNEYAKILGYTDFYDFKVQREDGMTKGALFKIFDDIYEKTKYAQENIRKLEVKMPGLRKPWNFLYMMAGDFVKEEDQYFQFDEALERWGRSFAALGVTFQGGTLQLDLLDRKGKYANGFCHWPDMVHFKNGKRISGSSNFTCNTVFGQVGSGAGGIHTLFHEGGHCAHLLNVEQKDVCVNHEYAPMSMAWAEVQSMFMDTLFASVEWKHRYARNEKGEAYPLSLFEKKLKKLNVNHPLGLNSIMSVANFEKQIYEAKSLTAKKVKDIAKKVHAKYFDRSEATLDLLNIPHIYSWESSASYHGYGLAELGVYQWREYFSKKYGYIVDNPNVGKEMKKMWAYGASKTFAELIVLATGKELSADAWLRDVNRSVEKTLEAKTEMIRKLEKIPKHQGLIKLDGKIKMVSGKKVIATNAKSFEDMSKQYKKWLRAGIN